VHGPRVRLGVAREGRGRCPSALLPSALHGGTACARVQNDATLHCVCAACAAAAGHAHVLSCYLLFSALFDCGAAQLRRPARARANVYCAAKGSRVVQGWSAAIGVLLPFAPREVKSRDKSGDRPVHAQPPALSRHGGVTGSAGVLRPGSEPRLR
jgi:hypothetical protein